MAENKIIDWTKLDAKLDMNGINKDLEDYANNSFGEYEEVPDGTYEANIEKMELGMSKNEEPMAIIWFNILAGPYKGQKVFYYQLLLSKAGKPFGIHKINELLKSLEIEDVKFESLAQYNNLLLNSFVELGGVEFELTITTNKKGFKNYEVGAIFE